MTSTTTAHFVFIGHDKSDALATRVATREEHLAFLHGDLAHYEVSIVFGGPLLAPDGITPNGSLVVVEAPSLQHVGRLFADDPYMRAGIFRETTILPWRFAIGRERLGAAQP